jgi:hypothetical protein
LAICPWVCNCHILDFDCHVVLEFPELVCREVGAQISDDSVGEAKLM